jgi:hypothetical protein
MFLLTYRGAYILVELGNFPDRRIFPNCFRRKCDSLVHLLLLNTTAEIQFQCCYVKTIREPIYQTFSLLTHIFLSFSIKLGHLKV